MARECLMDDSGYRGFEECANYESCTNDFVAELLDPYDAESIAELVKNSYNKGQETAVKYLVKNGYIKYGFETEYLLEQLKEKNMTIDEELEIINDNIDEYGQTNITREEYAMIYRKGGEHYQDKLRILKEWKDDVMDSLCKYDCNSVEEVAHNAYNQALKDLKRKIDDEYYDGSYGNYHEVEMIVRMIERLKRIEL